MTQASMDMAPADMAPAPVLVLASASPARAAILRAAGLKFEVKPAAVDEAEVKVALRADHAPPEEAAVILAALKAEQISRRHPEALVIGSDQILVRGETWFDKPGTREAAARQLAALAGATHVLHTAVVVARGGARLWHHLAQPVLTMRPLDEAAIDRYLEAVATETGHNTGNDTGYAAGHTTGPDAVGGWPGGYQIEGRGIMLFDAVKGDETSIRGLPLLPLLHFLRGHGVDL